MAEQKRKTLTSHEKVKVIKHKKKAQEEWEYLQEYSELVKLRSKQFWKNGHGILKQFEDNDPGEWKFGNLQLQNMITVMEMHKEKEASEIFKK